MSATQQPLVATPPNTSSGNLIGYGVGQLGSATTGATGAGNAASQLYNPLLQQYLSNLNSNPLANLYQTGGTSNPLLEQYMQAAGIPLQQNTNAAGVTPNGATTGSQQSAQGITQANQANGQRGVQSAFQFNGVTYPSVALAQQAAYQAQQNGGAGTLPGQQANANNPNAAGGATTPSSLSPGAPAQPNQVSIAANVASPQNPYGLTQIQQTQLNGQIETYQKQSQSAVSQYHQDMSNRGISPEDAQEGAALISQTYNQMSDQLAAQFAQQAQATQLAALQNLIGGGETAFNTNQNDLSGILGSLQSEQNLGYNTSLNAGSAALGQANTQNQQAQQNQASQNSFIGSLLSSIPIIGGLFGGGGGGGSAGGGLTEATGLLSEGFSLL